MCKRILWAIPIALLSALPGAAQLIYEVDMTFDFASGPCTPTPNDCPLRSAVTLANNDPIFSQIILRDEIYQLTIPGANEDNNATGDLDILMPVDILVAPGASPVIEQTTRDRVIEIDIFNSTLRMVGPITITGGSVLGSSDGGGISARIQNGGLELEDVVLTSNLASMDGGCLHFVGTGGSSLSLHRVTLTDCVGQQSAGGASLSTQGGPITITSSLIEANRATSIAGGLDIQGFGSVVILDTTIRGNRAGSLSGTSVTGGGIHHNSSSLVLRQSTVSDNQIGNSGSTLARGGGIYTSGTTVLIENSTISGNRTSGLSQSGAGIYVSAFGSTVLTLDSSSVVDNPTDGAHSIWVADQSGVSLSLKNSIIDDGCNGIVASIISNGFNVERPWDGSTNTTCNLTNPSDLKVTDLMLRPLAGYGGPTETHALLPGSPAQFLVSSAQCQAEDQRHAVRAGLFCDAGAYNGSTVPPGQWIFADGFESGDPAAWSTAAP